MAIDYKALTDLFNPKEEEKLFSPMTPTQDQLMTPANPTPEQLASIMEQQAPEPEVKTPAQPVVKQNAPKKEDVSSAKDKNLPPSPEAPMSKSEALIAEYNKLLGKGEQDLAEARKRDRMLKVGGALGDALATYLNAQGQMNVKAPGVQVQQGAGLGEIASMFATAPEIASDVATKREAMMKQYAELAKGERAKEKGDSAAKIAEERNKTILEAAGIRASGKGELTPYQEMMQETKKNEAIDKKTQKLQADLQSSQNVATTIDSIEQELGFNLDDIDSTGKIKGKSIDIPGVSIPGIGRTTFYSTGARDLDSTMSKLFNVELKNRSGVAVTPPELQNLKKEFNEGKFNTEEEKLKAMKRFKEGLKKAFANIEAGYPKEVVSEYQDRGGFTSNRFSGTSESVQKSEKDKETQNYADKYFKGDYDKASRFLKNREGI